MTTVTMRRPALRLSSRRQTEEISVLTEQQRKRARRARWLRLGVIVAMITAMIAGLLLIFAVSAHADEKKELSLYKLSSVTAAYFGNSQAPGESEGLAEGWKPLATSAANSGALLGYPDSDKGSVLKWLTSALSGSSVTYNYDAFSPNNIQAEGAAQGELKGMLNYAYFGASLQALGLDSTSSALSPNIANFVGGAIMLFFYVMSAMVDLVFWALLGLIKYLNPFSLFFNGIQAVNPTLASALGGNQVNQNMTVMGQTFPHPLYGLASFIGGWYKSLYSISMAMVPIFIGVLIVSLLLFRKGNNGGKIKRLLVRMIFIVAGVPILGGLYTGAVGSLVDTMGNQGSGMGATRVVLSTYVDFESWATINRLYVPKSGVDGQQCTAIITWQGWRSEPEGRARAGLRNTALCINNITGKYGPLGQITTTGPAGSATGQWNQATSGQTMSGQDGSSDAILNTVSMLMRYMGKSHISASDFETGYQSALTSWYGSDSSRKEEADKWFSEYAKVDDLKDRTPMTDNPILAVNEGAGLTADSTEYPDFSAKSGTKPDCRYATKNGGENCNMSVMATYNYLNTSFGPKSMTVYSSEKSSSGAIREMHNSVNQIGTGLMGFLYWFNSIVMLACFTIIGGFYAIAMVIGSLRRSIQTVTAIPFAMLGAVNSIAKVIVYAVAMIVELLATIFIYLVMQEIMFSLPQIIEMPLANIASGTGGAAVGIAGALAGGGWLAMGVLVFSSVFIIWFTALALKIRKGFISGINEAVTKVVEKFTDGQVTPPGMSGPSMAGALAGGAATGLGMAAAGKAMGGGKGGSNGPKGGASAISSDGNGKALAGGTGGGGGGPLAIGADALGPDGGGPGASGDGDINVGAGTGADGAGGQGGDGVDGAQEVDEYGRPVGVEDSGSPIAASGEDAGASEAVAGSDAEDRQLAGYVAANGLSTSDEPGERGDQQGALAGVPASESMDPNTKVSTAEEISEAKQDARKDQATGGAKAVVGAGEAAVGAYTGNAEMAKDGAERMQAGASQVQQGQKDVKAANDKVGSDGGAKDLDGKPDKGGPKGADSGAPAGQASEKPSKKLAQDGGPKSGAPDAKSAAATAGAAGVAAGAAGAAGAGGKSKLATGAASAAKPGQQPKGAQAGAKTGAQGATPAKQAAPKAGAAGAAGKAGGTPAKSAAPVTGAPAWSNRPKSAAQPKSSPAVSGAGPKPASASGRSSAPGRSAPAAGVPRRTNSPARSGGGQSGPVRQQTFQQNSSSAKVNVNTGGNKTSRTKQTFAKAAAPVRRFAQSDQGKAAIQMGAAQALNNAAQVQQQRRAQKEQERRREQGRD